LEWDILVDFTANLYILQRIGKFYGHFVHFVLIWYISPRFGILDQEKSGNPAPGRASEQNFDPPNKFDWNG
jgi:hypothetical protein